LSGFDSVAVVDWSAGKRAARPKADAIWIGLTREGREEPPLFCPGRAEAEAALVELIETERAAGRRLLIGFDFPFGYPKGFARKVTGSDDPFALWAWLEARIEEAEDGSNNRFPLAEEINALFDTPGPFWGKPNGAEAQGDWPGLPYRKTAITYGLDGMIAEKRNCDLAAQAASSCFQLYFNPTVGSQVLTGLPVLERLRQRYAEALAVWPFEPRWQDAPVVLAEIWPGLIKRAVSEAVKRAPEDKPIKDRYQVRLLARALAQLPADELSEMMAEVPEDASEEAWILGAGHEARLEDLAASVRPPPLRNDCFALPPGVNWTPVETALDMLRDRLRPVVATTLVPVSDAAGRVLAEDLHARRSNPPQPNSAVDGYGFSGGRPEGDVILPLVEGRAAAGVPFEGTVPEGHAIRILTGAALPEGVDTVVLEEDCATGAQQVAFHGPVKPGANTRRAGEDVVEGAAFLAAGRVLTPADLALSAALGWAHLPVRERLKVGVLSTGDEIVPAGAEAGPGQIYDANRPMLLAMLSAFGFTPVDLGHVKDDRATLRDRLNKAAREVSAILTSGGASAGDEDHVSALLKESGALQEWRIALKPGRPLALGMWSGVPVFGLPGNPVAAFVCTLIFARPALGLLAGAGWQAPQGFDVPAAFSKRKKPGRREYLRARMRDGRAEVFASEGSGRISGLSWAEGLVELGDEAREIAPGDPVRFIPYGSFGL
jgi:molybdopterin molybdotransferase